MNGEITKVGWKRFEGAYSTTKMIYNAYNLPYILQVVYPTDWIVGCANLTGDLTFVKCEKDNESSFGTFVSVNEFYIDDEMNDKPALEVLENKIREYVNDKGEIYEVTNSQIESLILDDGSVVDVLKFEYNEGPYYKTHCYCKIEIVDSIMYVATVGIFDKELDDQMLEIKDDILKTFRVLTEEEFNYVQNNIRNK